MSLYTLLGLFKGDRFAYGRALIEPHIKFSIVSSRIGYELACKEKLDKVFAFEVQGIGNVFIDSLCIIDKAIIEGGLIEKQTVFHIVDDYLLRPLQCDVILGADIINWWSLIIDSSRNRIYSLAAKPIKLPKSV